MIVIYWDFIKINARKISEDKQVKFYITLNPGLCVYFFMTS